MKYISWHILATCESTGTFSFYLWGAEAEGTVSVQSCCFKPGLSNPNATGLLHHYGSCFTIIFLEHKKEVGSPVRGFLVSRAPEAQKWLLLDPKGAAGSSAPATERVQS